MLRRQSRTSHHNEESTSRIASTLTAAGFECGECHKLFSRPENLARHKRATHTRESRYGCRDCGKRFTRSDLLKKHSKIHRAPDLGPDENRPQIESTSDTNHVNSSTPNSAQPLSDQQQNAYGGAQGTSYVQNAVSMPSQLQMGSEIEPEPHNLLYPMHLSAESAYDVGYQSYGEGLYDADLTWTFDYVSNDTQDPMLSVVGEGNANVQSYNRSSHTTFPEPIIFPSSIDKDSQSDWPDGQSRPVTPGAGDRTLLSGSVTYVEPKELNDVQHNKRIVPMKCIALTPANITRTFSILLGPELITFCGPCPLQSQLPDLNTAQHFLLLYFIHIHPRFPILHLPSFNTQDVVQELLLAMILAGSCYSPSNRGKFCQAHIERARMAMAIQREKDGDHLKSTENLHALFILSLTAIWTGQTEVYRRGESDRGMMISACRRSRLLDGRKASVRFPDEVIPHGKAKLLYIWNRWVESEKRKRLGLAIYLLDCQFAALLQRQPYISKAETTNTVLPCQSMYWEAPTAEAWKILLGTADSPPCFFHLPTLSSLLLRKELDGILWLPNIDDFSKTLYVYILHTHIFEWRQAMCMLNTTGLKESPVSLVTESPGFGLLDRQRWLLDSLETWFEAYGQEDTIANATSNHNAGGIILYHLGYLALSINFSDLYVAAGRSGSQDDILLAAESLRNRLSTDTTYSIMKHVSQMLSVAFEVVHKGSVQQHSFEVTVGLFMGGLIYWAMHHTLQQQELSDCLTAARGQFSPNTAIGFIGSPSHTVDERLILIGQINKVIEALKSIHCLGFSSVFASVLAKLTSSGGLSRRAA